MSWLYEDADGIALGFDGKGFFGPFADGFSLWSALNDSIAVSPVGPFVRYPFKTENDSYLAAGKYLEFKNISVENIVPPAGYESDIDDEVVY